VRAARAGRPGQSTRPRRIGLFGGTFDPPHHAHLALAHAALDALGLDEVRWVPAGQPWQKTQRDGAAVTSAAHRAAMVEAAIRGAGGDARFKLEPIEMEREGASYTIDTVEALRAREPGCEWVLLIGEDQYAGLHTWHRWRELPAWVTLAVARRPGVERTPAPEVAALPHLEVPLPPMALSATDVRRHLAAGEPMVRMGQLVPAEVAGYIDQHRLYGRRSPEGPSGKSTAKPTDRPTKEPHLDIRKLQRAIVDGLEDVKAQNIVVFNTEALSPLFERVIIASGNSNRQTKALASSVRDTVKKRGLPVLRTEGEDNGEWIIVDCGAAVAHIMQPAIRDYYHLEEIWGAKPVRMKRGGDGPRPLPKASDGAAANAGVPAAKKVAAKSAKAVGKTVAKKAVRPVAKTAAKSPAKAPAKAKAGAGRTVARTPAKTPRPPARPAPKTGAAAKRRAGPARPR